MKSSNSSDREKRKKEKERNQAESLFPIIQQYLGMKDIDIRMTEQPDFIFYRGRENLLGLEVMEYLPQHSKGKINVKKQVAYQKRFCQAFKDSDFLKNITKDRYLNIHIYPNKRLSKTNKDAFEAELMLHLKLWLKGINLGSTRHIRKLEVHYTLGDNVVYFNEGGRMDPCCWNDLSRCVNSKEEKLKSYKAQNLCNEYWLCIYISCDVHKSISLPIVFGGDVFNTVKSILNSGYTRIYITQKFAVPVEVLASAIHPC